MSTVERLKSWLGEPLFLVPQNPGTKIPMVKYTQETMESTKRDVYRVMLEHGNVAVRLGEFSGGFCAIDFDDDQSLDEFLKVNPLLANSARWKGSRGAQIGVRILGDYPGPSQARHATDTVLSKKGEPIGRPLYEWRSTGNLSTVHGTHPSGCQYQVLVPNPPAHIKFADIHWPEGWPVPGAEDPMKVLQKQFGAPWSFGRSGQGQINQRFFSAMFLGEEKVLYDDGPGQYFVYLPDRGLWQSTSREVLQRMVDRMTERVIQASIQGNPDDPRLETLIPKIGPAFLDGVVHLIRTRTAERTPFARSDAVIHAQNAMVDLRARPYAVHGFDEKWRSRNQCPVHFQADARSPKWQAFLDHALPDKDDQRLLQYWGGMALMQRNRCQVFLLLTGTGGGGKGMVASLIRRLVGDENCSELRTDHMGGRFEAGLLVSKTLLVGADVPPDFLQTGGASRLKAWTGGDCLQAEFKGRSEGVSVVGDWNVLITANTRLRINVQGDLGAWSRRILLLEFNQPKPATVIPKYHDVLLREEGSGILNWFLEGAETLATIVTNAQPFPLTSAQRQRVDNLLSESDSVRFFILNHVRRSSLSADCVTSENLFRGYLQVCGAKDWQSEPERRFQQRAAELMLELHQAVAVKHLERQNREESGKRGYRNVMLVSMDETEAFGHDILEPF